MKINIKPLSVNCAFKGKRFKTKEYDVFIKSMLFLLPKNGSITPRMFFKLKIVFGFSSKAADIDNCLKTFIDCLVKKYNFDDRNIYELYVKKEIVAKGKEFIDFDLIEI